MKSATAGSSPDATRHEFHASTVATPPSDSSPVMPPRTNDTESVRIASSRSSTARRTSSTRRAAEAEKALSVTSPCRLSSRYAPKSARTAKRPRDLPRRHSIQLRLKTGTMMTNGSSTSAEWRSITASDASTRPVPKIATYTVGM